MAICQLGRKAARMALSSRTKAVRSRGFEWGKLCKVLSRSGNLSRLCVYEFAGHRHAPRAFKGYRLRLCDIKQWTGYMQGWQHCDAVDDAVCG